MKWDKEEDVLRDFPLDEWNHIPVASSDEARHKSCMLALESAEPVFGEVRWFKPDKGVLLIRLDPKTNPKPKEQPEQPKGFLQRILQWFK